ncbi:3780_t:CDS:2 [Racocetra fulgida]|uniref:3780_t:CDS:1 n=1 Tax=Racocetra fulgida TaxID=60492 RepID=A0A9N8ZZZ7_9GLOM|nr:3780_t:CDS:2 [Racocetra fulgida]
MEKARQDFINDVFIEMKPSDTSYAEEERLKKYAFHTWTSGNEEIDFFIQNAQIHAWRHDLVLEWYPWETFSNIELIGKGGYGTVFLAKKKVGRIEKWDYQNNRWCRFKSCDADYKEYVALKTIELKEDFLNERLQRWVYQSPGTHFLNGFTANDDGQYFLVLYYFKDGDLRKQLQHQTITWEKKALIVRHIAVDMKNIHQAGLIHR